MEHREPGIGPAIKRKQCSLSHCADALDKGISASSCHATPVSRTIRNVVKQIKLDNVIVDVSVVEAIRVWRYSGAIANTVAYNFELEDKGLFRLGRMDRMMAEDKNVRPPISVVRVGGAYAVLDGRHRLARAHLLGEKVIDAVVKNTGREDYVTAGGEENPGPEQIEAGLTEPMVKVKTVTKSKIPVYVGQKHAQGYKQSFVPKDKTSDNVNKDHINISAPSVDNNGNVSVRNTGGKRNNRARKNDKKGYRRNYRKDRVELVIPPIREQEKFDTQYLAKLLTGELPSREVLQVKFLASKLPTIYDCPCGKKNYGFPSACGCELKDQVLALYNNLSAQELDVIFSETPKESAPEKVDSDLILEKKLVAKEIKSVETAIQVAASNHKADTVVEVGSSASLEIPKIVRKRRGLYRILKTPGFFDFKAKFNHHHESIAKHKDQSKSNFLVVSDEIVIDDLYAYLRRIEYDSYPNRAAKLAHMTKMAAKWDVGRFKLNNQAQKLTAEELNRYFVTIQKVTDAKDTEFLLQEVKAYHSNSRFSRFLGKLGCYPKYLN